MANVYQDNTTESKLRGQYYTPADFVQLILAELKISLNDRFIDPSCGDGSFLCGVIECIATSVVEEDKPVVANILLHHLIGFDSDRNAIDNARTNLQQAFRNSFGVEFALECFHVFCVDALQYLSLKRLFEDLGIDELSETERLVVIGNPPYVEAKRLNSTVKECLKNLYPDAICGAPDLYIYFVYVCLSWLRTFDRLAFILPNKMMVNSNAQRIRYHIVTQGKLMGIWFATQANIFTDAAVYPVVIFACGKNADNVISMKQVERVDDRLSSLTMDTISCDIFKHTKVYALFPLPKKQTLSNLLERLLIQYDKQRLSDVCDIRWCISFHRSGLRNKFVAQEMPHSEYAYKFIGGGAFSGNGEVARYSIQWFGWWIDYDEDRLRKEGNALPKLSLFSQPKIAICQNGRTIRAAFDDHGYIFKDTFLCGIPRYNDSPLSHYPRAIVGILNSKVAHFFYSHVFYGGHVNGGYLHFLNTFLIDIPMGDWTSDTAMQIELLVRRREFAEREEEQLEIEMSIEHIVRRTFGLSPSEEELLESWIKNDENWQMKDRIRRPTL